MQTAQALVGNLLQLPGPTRDALPPMFTPDAIPARERELWHTAWDIANDNGGDRRGKIEAGEILARMPHLDTGLFTDCVDLASTSADAARQAAELMEAHQVEELRGAASALLKAEGREEIDRAILHLYDLAEKSAGGDTVTVRTLAEYLADPGALQPPPVIVPRLAWKARTVLLAAREKAGKSTLASGAVAAVSNGSGFLGGQTESARVLYVALEDHPGDVVRRLQAFGANPDNVFILDRVGSPLSDLRTAVARVQPALTIVDTLPALVESLDLEPANATQWTPVMMGLTRIARDSETALVILHHAAKSGTGYRDSSAIGASVDMILTLEESKSDTTARKVTPRGRWHVDAFTLRLEGDPETSLAYSLGAGIVSVDAQVLSFIEQNPECSTREIRNGVEGRNQQIDDALKRLIRERLIYTEKRGAKVAHYSRKDHPQLECAPGGHGLGHGSDRECAHVPPHGHATGHGAGHAGEENVPTVGTPIGCHGAQSPGASTGAPEEVPT